MSSDNLGKETLIGNTGVTIPSLCFGTSGLGDMPNTYGYSTPPDRAAATLRHILNGPYPFLDTSRNYGDGRSEQRIGQVVSEMGGLPDTAIISTKLDRDMESGCFDAARARESLEQSLTALNIDHVDILHLHDPEHAASLEEISSPEGALPELMRMKDEGLCKAVGLAAGRVDIMMPLINDWDFDILISHNRYTLSNRNADQLFDLAQSRGVIIMNAAPYAGGVLAKGTIEHPRYVYQEAGDVVLDPIRKIEEVCQRHNMAPGAAALQFSLRDSRIASTICGVTRPERVEQTIAWATTAVPEALWIELDELQPSYDDPESTRVYTPG